MRFDLVGEGFGMVLRCGLPVCLSLVLLHSLPGRALFRRNALHADDRPLPTGREGVPSSSRHQWRCCAESAGLGIFGEVGAVGSMESSVRSGQASLWEEKYKAPLCCLWYLLSSFNRVSIVLQRQKLSNITARNRIPIHRPLRRPFRH